jgi:Holliday junction resolvase RusA-like endonuclease
MIPASDARTVEFVVNTDPIPKARARTQLPKGQIVKCFVQARGNLLVFQSLLEKLKHQTFTPDRTKIFEREVALVANRAMAAARRTPLTVPIRMTVTFVLRGDPGTWPTAESDGDLDNLEKAVKDALNGIAYLDDRLVVEVSKKKICGPEPRIEVSLGPA